MVPFDAQFRGESCRVEFDVLVRPGPQFEPEHLREGRLSETSKVAPARWLSTRFANECMWARRDLQAVDYHSYMKVIIVLAMTLALSSPSLAEWPWHSRKAQPQVPNSIAPSSAPPSPDLPTAFTPGPAYRIGLGDVLRIAVWKEPEFSTTLQVRSDGMISLPLLNDVKAVGFTPMELAASLSASLKKYVDDPRVTVIVSQAKPQVFYMVGEVGHRGPMALAPNMTVLEALITAGPSTFANTKKIYVLRLENGVQKKLRVNYKTLVKGKSTNQNIVLEPGDMVVVP